MPIANIAIIFEYLKFWNIAIKSRRREYKWKCYSTLHPKLYASKQGQMEAPSEIRAAAARQIESDGTKSSPCLVASKILQDFLSHRIFKRMYEVLNVAK